MGLAINTYATQRCQRISSDSSSIFYDWRLPRFLRTIYYRTWRNNGTVEHTCNPRGIPHAVQNKSPRDAQRLCVGASLLLSCKQDGSSTVIVQDLKAPLPLWSNPSSRTLPPHLVPYSQYHRLEQPSTDLVGPIILSLVEYLCLYVPRLLVVWKENFDVYDQPEWLLGRSPRDGI